MWATGRLISIFPESKRIITPKIAAFDFTPRRYALVRETLLFIISPPINGNPVQDIQPPVKEPDPVRMKNKLDLPVWVLNLKVDKRRLRFMTKQLRALNLAFTVVEALDGRHLSPEDQRLYSKERAVKFSKRELTPGEIGCALSHARMWERMVREKLKEVLILEDDILIGETFPEILRNRGRLPKDWEFINFSTEVEQEPFGKFITGIHRASRHKALAVRSSAYLIRLKGAKKLLEHVYPIGHSADGITWRTDITGLVSYGVYPRVVILTDLGSSIWSRGEIKRPGFATRKYHEFIYMLKTISRFFGITQLIKKAYSLLRPAPPA
jgi:glycosyl transferase family 25